MLHFKMDYKCSVCNNRQSWYIMPEDEITMSKDIIRSNTKFIIQCKKCGQSYRLTVNLKKIEKKLRKK